MKILFGTRAPLVLKLQLLMRLIYGTLIYACCSFYQIAKFSSAGHKCILLFIEFLFTVVGIAYCIIFLDIDFCYLCYRQ